MWPQGKKRVERTQRGGHRAKAAVRSREELAWGRGALLWASRIKAVRPTLLGFRPPRGWHSLTAALVKKCRWERA